MAAVTISGGSGWRTADRSLIVALLLAYVPGAPGLGIDTREAANAEAMMLVYAIAFVAPLLALGGSWRWPHLAAWLALVGGLLAVGIGLLDLAGLLAGPPPTVMIVADAAVAATGAILAWRSRVLLRATSLTASASAPQQRDAS
jgi:hypothetical protein